jgi:hypothetical protein
MTVPSTDLCPLYDPMYPRMPNIRPSALSMAHYPYHGPMPPLQPSAPLCRFVLCMALPPSTALYPL